MMLTVDVNSNCVRYAAEAIPLYEPLLESGGSGRSGKSLRQLLQDYNLYGTSLLFLAALSTLSLILFVAFRYDPTSTMDPPIVVGDALLDALTNLGWSVDDWYNDIESPQYQAWKWMRPSMMGPGSEAVAITALLERFALVTLYAATNGPKWTRGFGFLTSPSASSLNALCDENDGSRSDGAMVCDDTGTSVTMLTLGYNMMEGTIPPELALLSNLEVLDLSRNNIGGTMPKELTSLTNLQVLNIAWNDFVGPLPEELGESIPFLDKVFLEHNGEDFASNVNGVLCNIPNMEYDDEAVFTDQDDFHSYSDLVASCNIPDCLCCTSCEG